jgi:signal transduction histidine kinase
MQIFHATISALLCFALIPPAVILIGIVPSVEDQTENMVIKQLEAIADLQVNRLNQTQHDALQKLGLIESRTQLRISLRDFLDTGKPDAQAIITRIIQDARKSVQGLELVEVLDLNGIVLASTQEDRVGQEQLDKAHAKQAQNVHSANEFIRLKDDEPMLRATGHLELEGRTLGIVAAYWETTSLRLAIQTESALGKTGETLLGGDVGSSVELLVPTRFSNAGTIEDQLLSKAVSGEKMFSGKETDYRGKEVMAATRHIPDTGWGIVVKMDKEEALGPVNQLKENILTIGVVTTVLAMFLAIPITRFLSRPVTDLADACQGIQKGDLEMRTPEDTLISEYKVLSKSFNYMAETLVNANRNLSQMVAERTKELSQAINELTRSNKDLEQFAYSASHNLQTPVRSVQYALSMFKEDVDTSVYDEEVQFYLNCMEKACENMQAQITGLLEFSRVVTESGAMDQDVDSGELIKELLLVFKDELDALRATVTAEELPVVRGNRNLLRIVFQNLIENAIKYREYDRPLHLLIKATTENEFHKLFFMDNGIGIKEHFQEQIFKMFKRLHTNEERPGTGIGLGLCQSVIERHGGTIRVEPNLEAGNGSVFIITLPQYFH